MPASRVGPKVKVNIQYLCNGCEYHQVNKDEYADIKYHACHHPLVIKEYTCPQYTSSNGNKDLTIYHTAPAPSHLCPYLDK